MAYTEQDILGKIGDLLVDVNEHYAALEKDSPSIPVEEVNFLTAKVKFLAAHMDLWSSLVNTKNVASNESSNAEIFTPAIAIDSKEADNQPVLEEIQELEPLIEEGIDEEVVMEIETVTPEITENIPSEAEEEETFTSQVEEVDPVVEPDTTTVVEESIQESKATSSSDWNIPSPVHTASSNYTDVSASPEEEMENTNEERIHAAEDKPTPVSHTPNNWSTEQDANESVQSKEVVIEEKQVSFTEPVKDEVTLNDLAKQAEVRPNRPLTLNELIQQQKQAGVTNAQQFVTHASKSTEGILDLKTGVSLNDKLLFIKDLFNGYSLAYSEAIELLNRYDNFAEADAFLQSNYALKNNWSAKPQTVDKLYGILRKKFG